MQYLKSNDVIEFRPNAMQEVRKKFGLDQPGRMDEAINRLDEWIKKQDHFVKKDFSRDFLERLIIVSKGRIERTKLTIDRYCTYRTLLPQYFLACDVAEEFKILTDVHNGLLPKQSIENLRFYLLHIGSDQKLSFESIKAFFLRSIMLYNYARRCEYSAGYIGIIDLRDMNLKELVTHINPIFLKEMVAVFRDAFGITLKGVHFMTESKAVEMLISIVKIALKPRIPRIYSHANLESLHDYVPKDLLPKEYGGKEKSLKKLSANLINAASDAEFIEYMKSISDMKTDESKRPVDVFNSEYFGTSGTFRSLIVD